MYISTYVQFFEILTSILSFRKALAKQFKLDKLNADVRLIKGCTVYLYNIFLYGLCSTSFKGVGEMQFFQGMDGKGNR